MFKKMISFSLCVLLCTQSTTLFAGPIREDTLVRPSVPSTLAPQIAPNRYVNERMSALSEKISTSVTSWLNHQQQQVSNASNRASKFATPWIVYGKDQLGVAHTQVSDFIKHNNDDVVFWTIQGAAMSAVCLFVSPIEVSSTFLPYLSPNWIYKSVWAFLAGSIFHQSVVPVLSKESFYKGVSNMKQHMQEGFDDSKQKISAGSAKVAELAAPWCAYGRDKMTAGLKEAHNKARAILLPSAQSVEDNKRFAQIEKPCVMDWSKNMTVLPKPHPKSRLNAKKENVLQRTDERNQRTQNANMLSMPKKQPRKRKSRIAARFDNPIQ
ncbi:MAG: hypothetical protein ACPGUZ_02180 [Holosporaceae bacterium]